MVSHTQVVSPTVFSSLSQNISWHFFQARQADNRLIWISKCTRFIAWIQHLWTDTHIQSSSSKLPPLFFLSQCVKMQQLEVGLWPDSLKFHLIHFSYALLPFGVLSLDLWDGLELKKISLALKCHSTFVQKQMKCIN